MPNDDGRRLLDLVDEALGIEPSERANWLDLVCAGDSQLRYEVEDLLSYQDQSEALLQLFEAPTNVQDSSPFARPQADDHSPSAYPEGSILGDYRIDKQIGAGGMGVVFQAKQQSLNRIVALKVLPTHLQKRPNVHARFLREIEAAAQLQHDHIVAVYTAGEEGDCTYYAMELIDGPSLSEIIVSLRHHPIHELQPSLPDTLPSERNTQDLTRLPDLLNQGLLAMDPNHSKKSYFQAVAEMLTGAANGLSYAHQNQIIHRDIKPSNLLLAKDGRLHISDFGLARILSEPSMTQTGEFIGTPHYMAPEQINADAGTIDGRTDIYGLGATLYELLTLRPLFPGTTRDEVLTSIMMREPKRPKRINHLIPRDLETICLKAIEKDPNRRYQSARQMADDLQRFVQQKPIHAHRSGPLVKSAKWCRRHPSMAISLLIALGLSMTATLMANRAHESNRKKYLAEQQRDVATVRASQAEQALRAANAAVNQAQQTEQERIFEEALLAAMQGDEEAAQKAVHQAEKMGASAGRLHVMRGQIALFSASFRKALKELEAAVRLMPDNLAAHALLAETQARRSQWGYSLELLNKVRAMKPSTIEDLILKGRMESYHDSESAEQTLDQAIAQDKKNIAARLTRGIIRARRAYESGNPMDAEHALDDFELASTLLEETPYLLSELLSVHLTAAGAYEAIAEKEAQLRHLERASVIAKKLEPFHGDYQAHRWRAFYFEQMGDLDKVIVERQAIQGRSIGFLTMSLYQAGRFEEALTACDEYRVGSITGTADFCHSFVLAGACSSVDQFTSDFHFDSVLSWDRNAAWRSTHHLWCLAGKPDFAAQEVRKIGITEMADPQSRIRYRFLCGEIPANDYLQLSSTSRYEQARAHSVIGIDHLGHGRRELARHHLKRSTAFRFNYNFFTSISNALLTQLDRNPQWPSWIKD